MLVRAPPPQAHISETEVPRARDTATATLSACACVSEKLKPVSPRAAPRPDPPLASCRLRHCALCGVTLLRSYGVSATSYYRTDA